MRKSGTISASDISKFVYCPYQWYYKEIYGLSELKRLKQEKGEYDDIEKNLKAGIEYHHNQYEELFKPKRRLLKFLIFVVILILIALLVVLWN